MNFLKFVHVSIVLLGTGLSATTHAIDLYVDTKTKQIYIEPGEGREHLGSFKREV